MDIQKRYAYKPDLVFPPGYTILEILEEIGMEQEHLARKMSLDMERLNRIVQGREAISVQIAKKLEKVLAVPASFWINMEQNYRSSGANDS